MRSTLSILLLLVGCPSEPVATPPPVPAPTPVPEPTIPIPEGPVHSFAFELHPDYGTLVYATWHQDEAAEATLEFQFDPGIWHSTPPVQAVAGSNRRLVVGIPYDTRANWRIVTQGQTFDSPTKLETGPHPEGLPVARVHVANPSGWLPGGNYLLTSINQEPGGWRGGWYWTVILDRMGRPVWASRAPDQHWTLYAQVSVTRDHLLWDEATFWAEFGEGEDSKVHRTYLDEEIEVIDTPGLHHAFVELPDGTLAWGSKFHAEDGDEALIEKAPGASEAIVWNCHEDWPGASNCESNSIFYHEPTDSYLYSFYTNNSVVELDRGTGSTLWWAGDVAHGYDFIPADTQFTWQHGISYTEAGTLLLSTEVYLSGTFFETWVREYTVDHSQRSLEQIWSYSSEVYAGTNGDAWRLANGNTLHVVGSASHIREVDANGVTQWHVAFGANHLLGRGEFIEDLYTLVSP